MQRSSRSSRVAGPRLDDERPTHRTGLSSRTQPAPRRQAPDGADQPEMQQGVRHLGPPPRLEARASASPTSRPTRPPRARPAKRPPAIHEAVAPPCPNLAHGARGRTPSDAPLRHGGRVTSPSRSNGGGPRLRGRDSLQELTRPSAAQLDGVPERG